LIGEEAVDKTDIGFDAATFAQHFDQFSPAYGPHFKDIYRHMRAHCPVAHTNEGGGFRVVTRYAGIVRAAGDYQAFASSYGVFAPSVKPDPPKEGPGPFGEKRTGPLAANLDETEFENPEAVDFDRANQRHIAFGMGVHRCIAADVVRLEFRSMFERILSRMPDFRVDEAGLRASQVPASVAGYQRVPFVFTPGKKPGTHRIAY
jgi:cytochrome P450